MTGVFGTATMPVVDLLVLADREAQRLTDENDHSAAAIMRALAELVRSAPNPTPQEPTP